MPFMSSVSQTHTKAQALTSNLIDVSSVKPSMLQDQKVPSVGSKCWAARLKTHVCALQTHVVPWCVFQLSHSKAARSFHPAESTIANCSVAQFLAQATAKSALVFITAACACVNWVRLARTEFARSKATTRPHYHPTSILAYTQQRSSCDQLKMRTLSVGHLRTVRTRPVRSCFRWHAGPRRKSMPVGSKLVSACLGASRLS